MTKRFRMITLLAGALLFSACSSAHSSTSTDTAHDNAVSAKTETKEEGDLRLHNGSVEYMKEDGTWATLVTTDELEKAVKESNSPAPSPAATASAQPADIKTVRGAKGEKGATGATGATGAAGSTGRDGKDGRDGTQVTIDSEGQLILDGVGTGYYLTKKETTDKKKIDAPSEITTQDNNIPSTVSGGRFQPFRVRLNQPQLSQTTSTNTSTSEHPCGAISLL